MAGSFTASAASEMEGVENLEVERRIPEGGWLYGVFEADWIRSRKGKVEGKAE